MDDDGLPMRESGDWIKRKHHYLGRYCDMFTTSMRDKWHRVYIDVMAGPGRCRIRGTNEILPGSPFVALERDFDEYRFFEENPDLAEALRQRVATHPKAHKCRVITANWTQVVCSSQLTLSRDSLTLAFIDPTGISQVPWSAVRSLAQASSHIDLMFTIQHALGIKWNAHQYVAPRAEQNVADAFAGGPEWQDRIGPTTTVLDALIGTFMENMGALGFRTRDWQPVKLPNGVPLYYLCLFSRSPLAMKFWKEVVLKNEAGQRAFKYEDS